MPGEFDRMGQGERGQVFTRVGLLVDEVYTMKQSVPCLMMYVKELSLSYYCSHGILEYSISRTKI